MKIVIKSFHWKVPTSAQLEANRINQDTTRVQPGENKLNTDKSEMKLSWILGKARESRGKGKGAHFSLKSAQLSLNLAHLILNSAHLILNSAHLSLNPSHLSLDSARYESQFGPY